MLIHFNTPTRLFKFFWPAIWDREGAFCESASLANLVQGLLQMFVSIVNNAAVFQYLFNLYVFFLKKFECAC